MMAAFCLVIFAAAQPREPDPAARLEDLRRAGAALRDAGRLDEAAAAFRKAVGVPEPPGLDREALAAFLESRAEAQWDLAETLYARGAYEEALAAYVESRDKYPRRSMALSPCGKVGAVARFEASLGEARCLERLGRYGEAAAAYLRMLYGDDSLAVSWDPEVSLRLVDLYEAAGQADDLRAILEERDGSWARRRVEESRGWISRSEAERDAPGRFPRRVLELRRMEREQRWEDLAAVAAGGPEKLDGYGPVYWEAAEACRILARHPAQSVRVLLGRAAGADPGARPWVIYALGLTGLREAVEAVLVWVRRAGDPARVAAMVKAFRTAGPPGRAAAEAVEREARDDVRRLIGDPAPAPPRTATPLPEGIRLPRRL